MSEQTIIDKTRDYVRRQCTGESSGHDWWHIDRVWRLARHIAQAEQADLVVVELAALLHDIADWKLHDGDLEAGPRAAQTWLSELAVDRHTIDRVCAVIRDTPFQGAQTPQSPLSREGQIVQDADRLDAMGAIGIARAFAFGGHIGQPLHEPQCAPTLHDTFAAYKNKRTTTVNHFHEKLLLLKDRMNTPTGKKLAQARHAFMIDFLKRFDDEWDGAI